MQHVHILHVHVHVRVQACTISHVDLQPAQWAVWIHVHLLQCTLSVDTSTMVMSCDPRQRLHTELSLTCLHSMYYVYKPWYSCSKSETMLPTVANARARLCWWALPAPHAPVFKVFDDGIIFTLLEIVLVNLKITLQSSYIVIDCCGVSLRFLELSESGTMYRLAFSVSEIRFYVLDRSLRYLLHPSSVALEQLSESMRHEL